MNALYPILSLLLNLLLYTPILFGIGYLSDDYDLLFRVQEQSIWKPVEQHHYSPFINFLFAYLSPLAIHGVALGLHCINTWLIYLICKGPLGFDRTSAGFASLLFAASPAGFEALAWCCAVGFVATVTWLLLALWLFLSGKGRAWQFALIQLGAFITWDWGILVFLLLFALTVVTAPRNWKQLIPTACVFAAWLFLKQAMGLSLGYHFNAPLDWLKIAFIAPLTTIYPEASKEFYQSFWGIGNSIILWILIVRMAFVSQTSRIMLITLLIFLGPQSLMGYPQSRYYYLLVAPVVVWVVDLFRHEIKNTEFRLAILAGLLLFNISWGQDRLRQWITSFSKAESIAAELYEASSKNEIAVIDLPDRWGTTAQIWMPWCLRCGFSRFEGRVHVYQSGASPHPYPVVAPLSHNIPEGMVVYRVNADGHLEPQYTQAKPAPGI